MRHRKAALARVARCRSTRPDTDRRPIRRTAPCGRQPARWNCSGVPLTAMARNQTRSSLSNAPLSSNLRFPAANKVATACWRSDAAFSSVALPCRFPECSKGVQVPESFPAFARWRSGMPLRHSPVCTSAPMLSATRPPMQADCCYPSAAPFLPCGRWVTHPYPGDAVSAAPSGQ